MGKVFDYLGISTGCITNDLEDLKEKKIMIVILPTQLIMSLVLII